ncbi:CHASE2 domain-containing protein [Fulvivirgaceae bacterium BMA10]|uniref:CHASE2 domain-containing protein n=1 Tax=Splendidivirga corallicola TaxID=3051826 RepID=A0ABT8KRZ6_9BACT|nr:CHASE2 domain-containing protein [Fulvivirgaceae bacterium BMA10]
MRFLGKIQNWYNKTFDSDWKRFWLDSFLGTGFIFFVIFFVLELFTIFNFLDPIGDALDDMEITDLVFSRLREEPKADDHILIVNIARLPRRGIAQQIKIINKYKPKVIGLDVFFEQPFEDGILGDTLLQEALSEVENLVMVSKVADYQEATDSYNQLEHSHLKFRQFASTGHSNLTTEASRQEEYKSCRFFMTTPRVKGKTEPAFAIKIAQIYDQNAVDKFLSRNNEKEFINFKGNALGGTGGFGNKFYALDTQDVLNENFVPDIVEGKIVIFGFMGEDFNDVTTVEDKFYTPLNPQYAGRAFPDMFGVVIHANILSMILNGDYINEMGTASGVVLSVFLCFFNVALFSWIYWRYPDWYDGVTKTIQLFETILLLLLIVMFFHWFNYKINLTLGIVSVLLAGDILEFYYGVIKNILSSRNRRQLFKRIN